MNEKKEEESKCTESPLEKYFGKKEKKLGIFFFYAKLVLA